MPSSLVFIPTRTLDPPTPRVLLQSPGGGQGENTHTQTVGVYIFVLYFGFGGPPSRGWAAEARRAQLCADRSCSDSKKSEKIKGLTPELISRTRAGLRLMTDCDPLSPLCGRCRKRHEQHGAERSGAQNTVPEPDCRGPRCTTRLHATAHRPG